MRFLFKQHTEIDNLIAAVNVSNYYTKAEVDDMDNELSTLILNMFNKIEVDTFFTDYYNIGYLNMRLVFKATSFNTCTKSEVGNIIIILDISSSLNPINNNGTKMVDIVNTR